MPAGLVRFALVRRENGIVLFVCCQRHSILSVRLQPLVKFVLSKRIRDASRYTIKKISLKFLFLSDIFLFPFIRQQVTVLA